jgi:hypothetical protein
MQSRWICRCLLAGASTLAGCNRADPLPPPTAMLSAVPESEAVQVESVVVPVRHEVASDAPRVRIHLTMVEIQGGQPFPKELPDLWTTSEAFRVLSTDEIANAVAGVEKTGIARGRAWPVIEVVSGEPGNCHAAGDVVNGVIVTPTMEPDGSIRVSIVPPKGATDNTPAASKAGDAALGDNETLVVAGPTSTRIQATVNRMPILGDIPYVGSRLFSSRTFVKQSVMTMYLVSCEAVPQ